MDGVKGSLKDYLITEGLSASDAGQVVNLAVSNPLSSILALNGRYVQRRNQNVYV